jgi:predicted RNase H-like nuclease
MPSTSTNTADVTRPPRLIEIKFHPQLVAIYDCWRAQADKSEARRVCKIDHRKVRVNVVIRGDVESALKQLKAIGFEPERASVHGREITGKIAVDRLDALAGIAAVVFVAPEAV